ncbi:MAG: hypothetical protein ACRD1N_12200, partial [Terriglobia bacterium]
FDDWYCFRGNPDLGEQRAFREWAQSKPEWYFTEYQKEGPSRNSFIVSRKEPVTSGEVPGNREQGAGNREQAVI